MTDNPLINIGDLAKPATTLIEKISEAIGGVFRPLQIRRVASAEAEAEKIRALSQIEITELHRRALIRFVAEETKKQSNIEAITQKAITGLHEDAQPQNIENDWISNFFDKCRLISDEQMQLLWAKILEGEANEPDRYSKRTVNFLSSLDKSDALLFTNLCSFCWTIEDDFFPLIYDSQDDIFQQYDITFSSLTHMDEIGLISFDALAGYIVQYQTETFTFYYNQTPYKIKPKVVGKNEFNIGQVILSKVGRELATISNSQPIPIYVEYILSEWKKLGYSLLADEEMK